LRCFVRQRFNRRLTFLATIIEIDLEFVFGIGPFRKIFIDLDPHEAGRGAKPCSAPVK
jgi:hypothetical protein